MSNRRPPSGRNPHPGGSGKMPGRSPRSSHSPRRPVNSRPGYSPLQHSGDHVSASQVGIARGATARPNAQPEVPLRPLKKGRRVRKRPPAELFADLMAKMSFRGERKKYRVRGRAYNAVRSETREQRPLRSLRGKSKEQPRSVSELGKRIIGRLGAKTTVPTALVEPDSRTVPITRQMRIPVGEQLGKFPAYGNGLTVDPTVDFLKRRKQLRWEKIKHNFRYIAIGTSVFVFLSFLAWLFLLSPVFQYRSSAVEVIGANKHASVENVRKATQPFEGRSLFLISTKDIGTSITDSLPWVRSAKIEKRLPNSLYISLTMRQPAARVDSGGVCDVTGIMLPDPGKTDGLVNIIYAGTREKRSAGAKVAAALPKQIRDLVRSIDASNPDNLVLAMKNGSVVKWGDTERAALKVQVLEILLKNSAHEYSIVDPTRPASR